MKILQHLKISFILTAALVLFGTFALQVHAAETIDAASAAIDAAPAVTMGSVQTSTATLEGTSWKVKVISTSSMMGGFQVSSAVLTFSNGQLTVSDWIYNLDAAPYYEYPTDDIISFTATLTKLGTIPPQIFQVAGTATSDEKIVGLLYNLNSSGMMSKRKYVFWGEPLVTQAP